MPRHGQESSEAEVNAGGHEAFKGALHGAATVCSLRSHELGVY